MLAMITTTEVSTRTLTAPALGLTLALGCMARCPGSRVIPREPGRGAAGRMVPRRLLAVGCGREVRVLGGGCAAVRGARGIGQQDLAE